MSKVPGRALPCCHRATLVESVIWFYNSPSSYRRLLWSIGDYQGLIRFAPVLVSIEVFVGINRDD